MKYLVLFESTHRVIRAERVLEAGRVPYRIVPVPKEISAECGMAIELDGPAASRAAELLVCEGVPCRVRQRSGEGGV